MRWASLTVLVFGILSLASCTTSQTSLSPPVLEVKQVPHRSELIVRLFDESAAKTRVQCSIYRVLEDEDDGNEIEAKIADIRLTRTDARGSFIGVYSNDKEFPHGTKVVALYRPAKSDRLLRGRTRMYYH